MSCRLFALVGLLTLSGSVAADDLGGKLAPIIASHKGKVAVAVKHLDTGAGFAHNGDDVMPTASLIKLAIMVEAFRRADDKTVDLSKTLTLTKDDKVPGSGILTDHFSDGVTLPLRDAVRLMIVFSDNTATNLVLDQVGIKNVNVTTAALGVPETRINSKVYKRSTSSVDLPRSEKYGLGSTTANETVKLLELIHTKKAASAESCAAMLKHLEANDDKELLVRFLPAGTVVAHKTGAVSNARTDAGILFIPTPGDAKKKQAVAVCVLTNENEDKRYVIDNAAQVVIAKIGEAVYKHFAGP